MILALFINPQGAKLLTLPFTTVARQAEQEYIAEWQSPNFHALDQQIFAWLLLLLLAVLGASRKRVAVSEILLALGFGFLGLLAVRNIYLFVVVAPPLITGRAGDIIEYWREKFKLSWNIDFDRPPTRITNIINWFLVLVLAVVVVIKTVTVFSPGLNWEYFNESLPVEAAEFLQKEQPEGFMFNPYKYGGYLIWALPEYPVFIDGRADLHGDELINQWIQVSRGDDGWEEILDNWDIGFVMSEPDMPILDHLEWAGWELIYEDALVVIYKRE
jgi:hypothetical protein